MTKPTKTQAAFMREIIAGTLKPRTRFSYINFVGYKNTTRIACWFKGWIGFDARVGKLCVTPKGVKILEDLT